MLTSIVMILYYSISVISPNSIEKTARNLKKKISRINGKEGSILEFIVMYEKITELSNRYIPQNVLNQIQNNKGNHFEYNIELLYQTNITIRPIIPELKRIHRYYQCVVNCTPMTVSQEMCIIAQRVILFLKNLSKNNVEQKSV